MYFFCDWRQNKWCWVKIKCISEALNLTRMLLEEMGHGHENGKKNVEVTFYNCNAIGNDEFDARRP